MTIREEVVQRKLELRDMTAIGPHRATQITVELSSLWANINEESVRREDAYNKKLLAYLDTGTESVAGATIRAKATDEYRELRECEMLGKSVKQMISSLNRYIDLAKEEARGASY